MLKDTLTLNGNLGAEDASLEEFRSESEQDEWYDCQKLEEESSDLPKSQPEEEGEWQGYRALREKSSGM